MEQRNRAGADTSFDKHRALLAAVFLEQLMQCQIFGVGNGVDPARQQPFNAEQESFLIRFDFSRCSEIEVVHVCPSDKVTAVNAQTLSGGELVLR